MAKVIFEFNDEESNDVDIVNSRHKIMYALYELSNLRRTLYKGYLSDEDMISVRNKEVLTSEDINKEYNETGKPVEGAKTYISYDYIEREIDRILDDVSHLLD